MRYTLAGFVIVVLACMSCGLFSYLTFGSSIQSIVLFNLPSDDPVSVGTKLCYFFTIMGSYVILIQPVFSLIESKKWYTDSTFAYKFSIIRISVVLATIYISTCLPDIHIVLSLSGSVTGTLISVVLPVLFYSRIKL